MAALATRYGLGEDALNRHKKRHLTPALRAKLLAGPELGIDPERLRKVEGQSVLANLVAIRHRLWAAFDYSEEHGDINQIARITSQLHRNVELCAQVAGALHSGSTNITNNILISAEYISLRLSLVKALQPFPDAAQAVAATLHSLETQAASQIASEDRSLAS